MRSRECWADRNIPHPTFRVPHSGFPGRSLRRDPQRRCRREREADCQVLPSYQRNRLSPKYRYSHSGCMVIARLPGNSAPVIRRRSPLPVRTRCRSRRWGCCLQIRRSLPSRPIRMICCSVIPYHMRRDTESGTRCTRVIVRRILPRNNIQEKTGCPRNRPKPRMPKRRRNPAVSYTRRRRRRRYHNSLPVCSRASDNSDPGCR